MTKWTTTFILTVGLGLAGFVGYRMARNEIAMGVYQARLTTLWRDYDRLGRTYNEAVKRTAVTELIVQGGRLSVAIRTIEGLTQVIETPFDPYDEIYIDYVVLDGRLWIRRVFDALTPPNEALVVDPLVAEIDWDAAPLAYGKAVYRRLEEGRWVVTVTGDGSLGLAKQDERAPAGPLAAAPTVRDYEPIESELEPSVEQIGIGDVIRWLFASDEP